ncbi:MAG: ATP-binding protein [Deltaproteobacteria bacterium]|nr:ATP-binding protein [Deltaproteobacteria bacterium]
MKFSTIEAIKAKAYKYDSLPGMSASDSKIRIMLNQLCQDLDKDLVVFFDEADLLTGPGLLSFLAQIRDGYNYRHKPGNKFPRSLALIGMRDIRDYIASNHPESAGGHLASPFNIVAERMTLANFTREETGRLYRQHTEATGQVFEDAAVGRAWHWSEGQPWLANALARQIVEVKLKKDYSAPVTAPLVDEAAESLIQRRDTHIDSLIERLTEPRVIKVMDAVFAGTKSPVPVNSDDRRYCQDLGLVVKEENGTLRPANKIYREVMSRVITDQIQFQLSDNISGSRWNDGRIIFMTELLTDFQKFWRHDSRSFPFLKADFALHKFDEATYSFILLAYLQKTVNGGAVVDRQYAEGRGAADISVRYKGREYLIEVKLEYTYGMNSLSQLAGYLDNAGEEEGWLVVFDGNKAKSWDEKIFFKTERFNDKAIYIFGC